MTPQDNSRLDRIEGKLDKLADAVVSLARMEERMITLFNRMDAYDRKHSQLEVRVTDIEKDGVGQESKVAWVERVIWVALAAVIAFLVNNGLGD
jgi:hypothetical protein